MAIILSKFNSHRRTFFTPIVLIILGYISFTHVRNEVPWDLLLYMTYALNIFNGQGYADMDGSLVFFRGPVFPAMIAVSYKLFGISALSALGVVKLFSVLNPVLIYYLGRKFFSVRIGLAASLCLLTSYSISFWSFQFIDPIWPFFVFLYTLFLYLGFEQEKKAFFVLAGVSLAFAFLTKEVAILFFPLGMLIFLWIKEYQKKNNLLGVAASLITTLIVLLPWILYLHHHDALPFLLGAGGPVVLENISITSHGGDGGESFGFFLSLFSTVKAYCTAFIYFYAGQTNTVTVNFTIAPLFLAAWLYVLAKACQGNKGCKILTLILFLFLPIILFIGKNHWRFGQVLFIMLISYIALLYSMSCLVDWICRALNVSTPVAQVLFISFVFVLIVVQVFVHSGKDFGYAKFFQKTTSYHLFRGESRKQVVIGSFSTPYLEKTVEKLTQISKSNEVLLTDSFLAARKIFFQLEGKRNVFAAPMLWCRNNKVILGHPPENKTEVAQYIHSNNLPLEPQYRLYLLFESQLIDLLRNKSIKYVIMSPLFRPLEEYFLMSDNYEKIISSGPAGEYDKTYHLYRVKKDIVEEKNLPFLYSDQVVLTLNKLKKNDPQRFKNISDTFLYGVADLSEEDVDSMLYSIEELPIYHKELGDQYLEADNIEMAITAYKEAVRLAPENKRFLQILADLYREEGMRGEAIIFYENLNRIYPGISKNYCFLGELYKSEGRVAEAIKEYEQAVSLLPEYWYDRHLLGELYLQSGLVDEAIDQYSKLVELRPGFGMYSRILGDLHKGKGMKAEALSHYKQALRGGLDKTYYQQLIDALERTPVPPDDP